MNLDHLSFEQLVDALAEQVGLIDPDYGFVRRLVEEIKTSYFEVAENPHQHLKGE